MVVDRALQTTSRRRSPRCPMRMAMLMMASSARQGTRACFRERLKGPRLLRYGAGGASAAHSFPRVLRLYMRLGNRCQILRVSRRGTSEVKHEAERAWQSARETGGFGAE